MTQRNYTEDEQTIFDCMAEASAKDGQIKFLESCKTDDEGITVVFPEWVIKAKGLFFKKYPEHIANLRFSNAMRTVAAPFFNTQ